MINNEDAWKAQSAKLYKKKEKQTETFVNSIRIFPLQYFIGVALIYWEQKEWNFGKLKNFIHWNYFLGKWSLNIKWFQKIKF